MSKKKSWGLTTGRHSVDSLPKLGKASYESSLGYTVQPQSFSEVLGLQSFDELTFETLLDTPYHELGNSSLQASQVRTQQNTSATLDLASGIQAVGLVNQDIASGYNEPGLSAPKPLRTGLVERTKARTT